MLLSQIPVLVTILSKLGMSILLAVEVSILTLNFYATSLRVTVLDPSGAVVTGSRVQIKSTGGQQQALDTNQYGEAIFTELKPGNLQIHVEANGFAPHTVDKFTVKAGPNQIEVRL